MACPKFTCHKVTTNCVDIHQGYRIFIKDDKEREHNEVIRLSNR